LYLLFICLRTANIGLKFPIGKGRWLINELEGGLS
jgi:hypothetical protein